MSPIAKKSATPANGLPERLTRRRGRIQAAFLKSFRKGVFGTMVGIVNVMSGICGMITEIRASSGEKPGKVRLDINSRCEGIQKLARALKTVNPMEEISFKGKGPKTLRMAAKNCKHASCPVPSGIIKAIEVASGLALPKNASIQVSKAQD